jgi:alkanesulfonate monooxygenase SsuD/methylene tetrahydromethanopterin reductase-like flavin-dependent oxidoreductase (luciferase family)
MESWTLLSALSQQTKRARIGAMVNSNTYRNPCITAKMAATLDHVSGGRLNLGMGAGWYELEHKSFGIDFKTIGMRLRALDEACQIIKGMFTQDKFSLDGKHYKVDDAVCNPKPLQKPHVPIMIGGRGEKALLKIVAQHADMWNTTFLNPEQMKQLIGIIERHGDTVGRNTDEIEKTIMMPLCYKAPNEREQMIAGTVAAMTGGTPEQMRDCIMIGGTDECLERIEQYRKVGVTHFIFSLRWPMVIDDEFQAFAEDVIPLVKRGLM